MDYRQNAEDFLDYMNQFYKIDLIRELNVLSSGEVAVLGYLSLRNNGVNAGDITSSFHIGTSRTAAILKALEKKGLARRMADPQDGRCILVYITKEGQAFLDRKRQDAIGHMADFLELLGPEDAKDYMRIIKSALEKKRQKSPVD
ncbi:MAG TPA: MarR family transcriptional regulator [Candidatus Onthocola gallistercoris]|uniref:MarR family transcriptional regulator n=1 Tax=Candidatus Onthocola gallistercoris TaxID=2840876 RepID=A0A9D1KYF6_9FIRM|nr:MarR family transcriptional regulator [Candidatus Onthocola gallistercoris]